MMFVDKDASLYEKAVQYYTNRSNNPVQLVVNDDRIKDILKDLGIKFIKE